MTPVWYNWGYPGRIAKSAWHPDRKGVPGSVPKMETVGPVSTCGRDLLRGWWRRIALMVTFTILTVSVRNILDNPVKYIGQKRQSAAENRTRKLLNQNAQPENSKVSAHVRQLQVRRRTALWLFLLTGPQRFIDKLHGGLRQRATSTTRNKTAGMLSDGDPHCGVHENMIRWHAKYSLDGL
jgi:hypothetical protein